MNAPAAQLVEAAPSDQSWGTPPVFIDAFQKRFGPIVWDLAAAPHNTVARYFFTEHEDALEQDWSYLYKEVARPGEWLWLNPPFADMAPWAAKCAEEGRKGARIALLSKVSLARWFVDFVEPNARVYLLTPRVAYVPAPGQEFGSTGKKRTGADFDSMLSLFGPATRGSIEVWKWKE